MSTHEPTLGGHGCVTCRDMTICSCPIQQPAPPTFTPNPDIRLTIQVPVKVTCPACDGKGLVERYRTSKTTSNMVADYEERWNEWCQRCNGKGEVNGYPQPR